jgi:hypothetical protein
MFNVLQARNVPSKFVMFPDEHHVSPNKLHTRHREVYLNANGWQVGTQARKLLGLAQRGAGLDQQVQWNL